MSQPIYIVDAFTNRAFAGNPAAVCPMNGPADAEWMQRVAGEMNLAETAFLYPAGDVWNLRWFTPTVEVDLCGHATLASAHILWQIGLLGNGSPARFSTRSGLLTVVEFGDGYEMDFPAKPVHKSTAPTGFLAALGAEPVWVGTNGMDLFAEMANERAVRDLKPNLAEIAKLLVRGVIVSARSESSGCDFVSRFFAPACGVPEDPVTGSAHCALGPYWSDKLGKNDLRAFQASPRGGWVHVGVRGDRVLLGGHAVTVLRGELIALT